MIAAVVITVVVLLIVSIAAADRLRRLVLDRSSDKHRRQETTIHTVTYAVPNGIDPVDLKGAINLKSSVQNFLPLQQQE